MCQNTPVQLATLTDPDTSGTRYLWSPATGLDDPTSPTPMATPDASTTYRLIATAASGACADTSEVRLTITPSDIEILQGDTIFRCLGSGPITLQASTATARRT